MNEIVRKKGLTPVTSLFEVRAPAVARKARAGQFVVVRVHDRGERIPLTVADYDRDRGTITLVVQEVGKTTMQMGTMQVGDRFPTLAGPLGRPADTRDYGKVICVGGGSSIAAIYPLQSVEQRPRVGLTLGQCVPGHHHIESPAEPRQNRVHEPTRLIGDHA